MKIHILRDYFVQVNIILVIKCFVDGGPDKLLFLDDFLSCPLFINMNKTNVMCEWCEKRFDKLNKEINRCKKNGFGNYCSRSCSISYRNSIMTEKFWREQYKKHPTLVGHANNRLDDLSPFKSFLNSGKASIKKHGVEVDAKYLKFIWEQQGGKCPYTGISMILPSTTSKHQSTRSLKKASLDRINSSLGYIQGNIEFVCLAINFAKNDRSRKEMIDFIKEIQPNRNTLSVTRPQPT